MNRDYCTKEIVPFLCHDFEGRAVRASQAVSRINKLRVINTDSGTESLPLRQILAIPITYRYSASCAQRKPTVPERSRLGAINRYFPCSVSLWAWGKYQIAPWGW